MDKKDYGNLYLCATPIGNLEDISLRALRLLREADLVAAEDTRHTIKLLNHYGISKPLISYHEHNQRTRGADLIAALKEGKTVIYCSDAGMPGISDPGADLVRLARQEGIGVSVLPGPSAGITGLVLSGLSTDRFSFEGFLPRNNKERNDLLERLAAEDRTIILYESPHRLKRTLKDLYKYLGDRKISLARELTKVHEQVLSLTIKEAQAYYEQTEPRGELVLVIEGNKSLAKTFDFEGISIKDHILTYINKGLSKKEAIRLTTRDRQIPKREVYQASIGIIEDDSGEQA
ncbi:MAG: 16S rRNA (cytidine(1402)-2'-O)-methyltransferase [Eubacteriales bacterium]